MPRYVVLEHQLPPDHPRGLHWDLMLQRETTLWTWSLAEPPRDGACLPAERLPDHRLAYLDFEGELTGNRGHVRRWDSGNYVLVHETPAELAIVISGERLSGEVVLREAEPAAPGGHRAAWMLSYRAGGGSGPLRTKPGG